MEAKNLKIKIIIKNHKSLVPNTSSLGKSRGIDLRNGVKMEEKKNYI